MMPVQVECASCGHVSTQQELTSTSTFGAPDLDLRPAEIARSALFVQVQECPGCGYCAGHLAEAPENVAQFLEAPRYIDVRADTTPCALARRFLLASFVRDAAGDPADAGWFAVRAAWACDDDVDPPGASTYRARAADLFRESSELGRRFAQDAGTEAAVLADLLRRSGQFREAREVCERALPDCVGLVGSVLSFQAVLARDEDDRAYTVADAENGIPPVVDPRTEATGA